MNAIQKSSRRLVFQHRRYPCSKDNARKPITRPDLPTRQKLSCHADDGWERDTAENGSGAGRLDAVSFTRARKIVQARASGVTAMTNGQWPKGGRAPSKTAANSLRDAARSPTASPVGSRMSSTFRAEQRQLWSCMGWARLRDGGDGGDQS
jgi:hypothetical protein